ncbi:MAG: hypothetical protein J3K34DRAFT_456098 [Monoraphidium minutum]|nr:MAG: hypothetical protein J3K34DRAFT_456098 [Monoraphidium minutum]
MSPRTRGSGTRACRQRGVPAEPPATSTAGTARYPSRQRPRAPPPAATAESGACAAAALLAAACSACAARAGAVPGGHRGLIAVRDLEAGDEILSVPLLNALVLPERAGGGGASRDSVAAGAADAAALAAWQAVHGLALPPPLAALLLRGGAAWEARLAALLLWLVQRRRRRRGGGHDGADSNGGSSGGSGSSAASPHAPSPVAGAGHAASEDPEAAAGEEPDLWDLYVDSLPPPHAMGTFYDFGEEEAEEWLALSAWRERAAAQRGDAAELHAATFGPDAGGGLPDLRLSSGPRDTAWALGLVRSRTFGRVLRASGGAGGGDAAAQADSMDEDAGAEGPVSLLMVPGIDLVNHSFDCNSRFEVVLDESGGGGGGSGGGDAADAGGSGGGGGAAGADASAWEGRLVVRALRAVPAGEEVTISYGGGKRNITLLADYGFIVPDNPNDTVPLPQGCGPEVALSLLRQMEGQLASFLERHAAPSPPGSDPSGGGGGAGAPSARRAVALAAARERLAVVRRRRAGVEGELAAAGMTMS